MFTKINMSKIGIIGLGYVGLPLALEFAIKGYNVTGFDIDEKKIDALFNNNSYLSHISSKKIEEASSFSATSNFDLLNEQNALIICVPTPLNKNREPNLDYVVTTTNEIAKRLAKNQLVILESTTYPGTTEDVMLPILEKNGLVVGEDFFLAYSPEREDPNNTSFTVRTIPKVIGGTTKACLYHATELYKSFFDTVVPVSSTKVAEAAKILENTYRAVNIALVNELKILFNKMGIDIWEVIEAAKSKPFGFQAFYPGPGLGGHCIPIDPFYLTWKAREFDVVTKFIELAGEINTSMPYYVIEKIVESLNNHGKSVLNSKILILGVAYKKDINDTRESPALKIMSLLTDKGAKLDYNDPYVPTLGKHRHYPNLNMDSVELNDDLIAEYDCVILLTDHSDFLYNQIYKNAKLIVDTRNAFKSFQPSEKIIRA